MKELLERLWAIKLAAKNAHYYFEKFGQHLLADFLSGERDEQIDLINEVCYLGLGEEAIPLQDILSGANKFVPAVLEDDQENLSNLKGLVKDTLIYIQEMNLDIVGIANLVGGIAQDLLQFHGLLYRQGVLDKDDNTFIANETLYNPYPNEIAARVKDPKEFDEFRTKKISDGVNLIVGKKPDGDWEAVSYRFSVDHFDEKSAKKWLRDNEVDYILFEPAKNN